jgi:hypothetical protein
MKQRKEGSVLIGISKVLDPHSGLTRLAKYSDLPTNVTWVTLEAFVPIYYDLVDLKILGYHKHKTGWYNGKAWSGLRLKPTDTVVAWKRTD